MLTRQGTAQLIASEFARLSNIDINYPDRSNVHPVIYRLSELIMAEKTIATFLSKTLEQTPKYAGKHDQNADEWLNDLIATCCMADITEAHALKKNPHFWKDMLNNGIRTTRKHLNLGLYLKLNLFEPILHQQQNN
ncbi:unnamed protein product [Rotaria sp. Silwood1]|nr:unnamed protein product [Rotaria sp. Silwood1]CAF4968866.1 unnamed protein product [Rotaria sp. Silwood1]